jgi:molybdate transport system ATP-binding protein
MDRIKRGLLAVRFGKSYGSFALKAAFELDGPGITVVFGPSGAGKTTLLSLLAGLARPDYGFIRYRGLVLYDSETGRFIPPEKRNIACVFQEARLFPHFSVKTNLLFASIFGGRGVSPGSFAKTVELLGLKELLGRKPQTLSGGEAQRVAIGRALLAGGDLLLMDEPLASLDKARKIELSRHIAKIPILFGASIVYVTHSMDELNFLADWVVAVKEGECRLKTRAEFLAENGEPESLKPEPLTS